MVLTSDSVEEVPLVPLYQDFEGYQVSWGYRLEVIWFCIYTSMMNEEGWQLGEGS
jgi:hypothetical protein